MAHLLIKKYRAVFTLNVEAHLIDVSLIKIPDVSLSSTEESLRHRHAAYHYYSVGYD
jgi:hypothetical protein